MQRLRDFVLSPTDVSCVSFINVMQLVKCCLLGSSKDETVRKIYEAKAARVMQFLVNLPLVDPEHSVPL